MRARGAAAARAQQPGAGASKKRIVAPNPAAPAYAALLGSCAVNALLRSSPTLQMYMRASGTSVGRPGSVPILAIQDGATRAALGRGEGQFPSVHAAYLAGHTIAIEAAEMWFSAVNRFVRATMAYFDYDFTAQLFFTPAERPIFAPRSSAHDLFVLQLQGGSAWRMNVPPAAPQPYARQALAAGDDAALAALDPQVRSNPQNFASPRQENRGCLPVLI